MESANINALRFDHTKDTLMPEADAIIAEGTKVFDDVVAVEKANRTYENSILTIAKFEAKLYVKESNLTMYRHVSTDKDMRDAAAKVEEKLDEWGIKQSMRLDLHKALVEYREVAKANGEWEKLTKEQQRYVDKEILDGTRNGLGLDDEKRAKVALLKQQLADLERKSSQNIGEDTTKVEFLLKDLDGLPQDAIDRLEKVEGKEETHRYISMKYPEIFPALRLVKSEEVRQKLDLARGQQCLWPNQSYLEELAEKRHEFALCLGYSSYSEFILEIRMAQKAINVQNFEEKLTKTILAKGRKEFEALQNLKREETGNPDAQLKGWDRFYYENIQKTKLYKVDEQEIKKYFPTPKVISETLAIYQELLAVEFTKLTEFQKWHEDVEAYEVKDTETKKLLGHFYLDLFPRDGKFGHAAVFPMIKRTQFGDEYTPSCAAMVCNFEKPTADKVSTMPHDDVVTFFHEFGHCMHNMCTTANFSRFSGTSVERDFVEMPSQMFENWMWSEEILARVSSHVDTGEPLPTELIKKKLALKQLNEAYFTLTQLFYGTFDLVLHSAVDENLLKLEEEANSIHSVTKLRKNLKKNGNRVDCYALWHQLRPVFSFYDQQEGTNPAATFGHLFGGYQSQYYGYLWSQVFSADAFDRFEKEGIMNKELGKKYRDIILAPGGSIDSNEAMVAFLGREPNDEAFMRQNGFNE